MQLGALNTYLYSVLTVLCLRISCSHLQGRMLQDDPSTTNMAEFPALTMENTAAMMNGGNGDDSGDDRLAMVYNSSEIPSGTLADVVIYGCTPAGLFTALRLLEPTLTQDSIREDVMASSLGGNGTLSVVIMEPSDQCGGRLLTAAAPATVGAFLAELGDMGYYSSPKAYADVLMQYLNLETKQVDQMVQDNNLMYLRGRYLRQKDITSSQGGVGVKGIYALNYIEQNEEAADLLMHAVDSLIPGAFEFNETEWMAVFTAADAQEMDLNGQPVVDNSISPYALSNMGFLNALSQVLSGEALEYVSTYFGDDALVQNNMNALEGVVCVVMMAGGGGTSTGTNAMKAPIKGMESIVMELQQRVLSLGGLIALGASMTDLTMNNATTTDLEANGMTSSTYDISFIVRDQGVVNLSEVGNVVFASRDMSSTNNGMASVVSASAFFDDSTISILTNLTNSTIVGTNGTGTENATATGAMNVPMLTLKTAIQSRVPVSYARLYMCYDTPWWQSPVLDITTGRSVTDLPLRSVMYLDHACLAVCATGASAIYWKHMAEGMTSVMFQPQDVLDMMSPDFSVWESRWEDLASNTPQVVIDDAQRQLKLLHNLPHIPAPVTTLYVTNEMVGDSLHQTVPGINPMAVRDFLARPREDLDVFFVGEASGTGFPYLGLEADLFSAENLVQMYFFEQAAPFTFDSTGELSNEQLTQSGLSVASSADGNRVAVVSSSQADAGMGEVTVYQRIGDEFLGLWKNVGTNFVSGTATVTIEVAATTTTNTTQTRGRFLIERTVMDNITAVALSGDGRTMAIGVVDADSGDGSVQLWKDQSLDGAMGNWTKLGMELMEVSLEGAQFGFAISLSYNGRILAVGAPLADTVGAVMVYDCSLLTQANPKDILSMNGDSSTSTLDSLTNTFAPAMGLLSGFAGSSSLGGTMDTATCVQMGKTMEGIDQVTRYGESVSLSYDGMVVAAGAPNTGTGQTGFASVFGYSTDTPDWTQAGNLIAGLDPEDQFGFSVSLSADARHLVVGAPGMVGETGAGYARVYTFDETTDDEGTSVLDWTESGVIDGAASGDNVGFSVALSGDAMHLLVGAPQLDNGANSTGYVLALARQPVTPGNGTGTWNFYEDASGELYGTEVGDAMGYAISIDFEGRNVALAAPQASEGEGVVRTFVYVEPPNGEGGFPSTSTTSSAGAASRAMARSIWRDTQATVGGAYPWEDDPCIEAPSLVNPTDVGAASDALAASMTAALIDKRLNPTVEQSLTFNMDMNSPMDGDKCTPLFDAANLLSGGPNLGRLPRRQLNRALGAYEDKWAAVLMGAVPTIPPVAFPLFPTLPPVASPTLPPVASSNTTDTVTESTDLTNSTVPVIPVVP
jgi:hypothetical protein